MATTLPAPGIYARKGSFNDRLLDGLVTVRVSVAVITPLGVEERELEFTAGDLLTAIQALLAAVDGLRVEDRQAIALRYFLDLSEAEMAAVLGCARGTVKSRLSRALGRLRERFGEVRHG